MISFALGVFIGVSFSLAVMAMAYMSRDEWDDEDE